MMAAHSCMSSCSSAATACVLPQVCCHQNLVACNRGALVQCRCTLLNRLLGGGRPAKQVCQAAQPAAWCFSGGQPSCSRQCRSPPGPAPRPVRPAWQLGERRGARRPEQRRWLGSSWTAGRRGAFASWPATGVRRCRTTGRRLWQRRLLRRWAIVSRLMTMFRASAATSALPTGLSTARRQSCSTPELL